MLEAQQGYFSYHAILVAIILQNSFVLVFLGYRSIIARYPKDPAVLKTLRVEKITTATLLETWNFHEKCREKKNKNGAKLWTPRKHPQKTKKYPRNTKTPFWVFLGYFGGILGVFSQGCRISAWRVFFVFSRKLRVGPSWGSLAGRGVLKAIHYRDGSLDAFFPGNSDSESVRIAKTTAVAKHYDFHRGSVFSMKGSFGCVANWDIAQLCLCETK